MKKIISVLLLSLTLLLSCEFFSGEDTEMFIYPKDGYIISGEINIQLRVPDSIVEIDTADLYFDNIWFTTINSGDLYDGFADVVFDTSSYDNGFHTLTVIMVDAQFPTDLYSNTVTFQIQN